MVFNSISAKPVSGAARTKRVATSDTGSTGTSRSNTGADAAGLAFEALEKARAAQCDVLLVDTAGRLHNKTNLMEELAKMVQMGRDFDILLKGIREHAVLKGTWDKLVMTFKLIQP